MSKDKKANVNNRDGDGVTGYECEPTRTSMGLERIHDTRNSRNVKEVFAHTTKKANCITVHGVQLWNTITKSPHLQETVQYNITQQVHIKSL